VGYSRLMGEDETATLKTLSLYQEIMAGLIKQHRGRIVDAPGDAVLAEFSSVVDAVQCAVAVQKELQVRNAELPENRRMLFRIGINLGDVIEEGEKIYGDGVNIAARLEALADPGGVCVSRTAFDHIETKLPLGYEFLGEKEVKNIARPVGAYRVLLEPRVTVAGEVTQKRARSGISTKAFAAAGLVLFLGAISLVAWQSGWFPARPGKQAAPPPQSPAPPLTQATPAPQVSPAAKVASPAKKSSPSPQTAARSKVASATQVSPPPKTSAPPKTVTSPPRAPQTPVPPTSSTQGSPSPQGLPKVASLPPVASQTPAAPVPKEAPPTPAAPSPQVAPPSRTVPPIPRRRITQMFGRLDINNDGKVTLDEFLINREKLFNRLDANNDGSVARFELSAANTRFAQKLMENFALVDANQDQILSKEEFLAASRRKFIHLDQNRDGHLSQDELIDSTRPRFGRQ
jgi:Ca2+-binding EF-hand superfamily protein